MNFETTQKKNSDGWPVGHCHTSPGGAHRVLGEDDIRFLFCQLFGPVNRR